MKIINLVSDTTILKIDIIDINMSTIAVIDINKQSKLGPRSHLLKTGFAALPSQDFNFQCQCWCPPVI